MDKENTSKKQTTTGAIIAVVEAHRSFTEITKDQHALPSEREVASLHLFLLNLYVAAIGTSLTRISC